jgi:hypothetical protein
MAKSAFEVGRCAAIERFAQLQQEQCAVTRREFLAMSDTVAEAAFKTEDARVNFNIGWTYAANSKSREYVFKDEVYRLRMGHPCRAYKPGHILCNAIGIWCFNETPMCDGCLVACAYEHPELSELFALALAEILPEKSLAQVARENFEQEKLEADAVKLGVPVQVVRK